MRAESVSNSCLVELYKTKDTEWTRCRTSYVTAGGTESVVTNLFC